MKGLALNEKVRGKADYLVSNAYAAASFSIHFPRCLTRERSRQQAAVGVVLCDAVWCYGQATQL